jgi:hypothetical protein
MSNFDFPPKPALPLAKTGDVKEVKKEEEAKKEVPPKEKEMKKVVKEALAGDRGPLEKKVAGKAELHVSMMEVTKDKEGQVHVEEKEPHLVMKHGKDGSDLVGIEIPEGTTKITERVDIELDKERHVIKESIDIEFKGGGKVTHTHVDLEAGLTLSGLRAVKNNLVPTIDVKTLMLRVVNETAIYVDHAKENAADLHNDFKNGDLIIINDNQAFIHEKHLASGKLDVLIHHDHLPPAAAASLEDIKKNGLNIIVVKNESWQAASAKFLSLLIKFQSPEAKSNEKSAELVHEFAVSNLNSQPSEKAEVKNMVLKSKLEQQESNSKLIIARNISSKIDAKEQEEKVREAKRRNEEILLNDVHQKSENLSKFERREDVNKENKTEDISKYKDYREDLRSEDLSKDLKEKDEL